jgi:RND family efflux transporter MFP subunit
MFLRQTARFAFAALLAAGFIPGSGCGVSGTEAAAERGAPPPTLVRVAQVRDGELTDRWTFLGEVRALARAELAAGADGEVTAVVPRVGDRVQQGQLLVRLDPSLAKARVAAASASRTEVIQELEQARRDRDRAQKLTEILPEAEIERDETRAQTLDTRTAALKAAEREAKAHLGRHKVTAPFSGVIAARYVDPGDWVGPGDPVLELVDDNEVEIIVAASEELLARVQRGDAAKIRHGDAEVEAVVEGVVRALDPATRTGRLRLLPKQIPGWMLPGVSVDAEFSIVREGEGLIVPRDALVYGAVGVRIIRIENDEAQAIPVEVVATADDEALVKGKGLAKGDSIVIRGNERLRPGQKVRIQTAEETAAEAGPDGGPRAEATAPRQKSDG